MDTVDTDRVLLRDTDFKPRGAPVYVGTFVLANTVLGAGMLALPYAMAGCGYVGGVIFIVLFASSATLGLHLLSEAANAVGRPATFHKVANAAIPGFGMLFDAAIAIKCFGVATSYLVVVKQNVPEALEAFHVPSTSIFHEKWLWVLIAVCFVTPLSFLREISRLRFTAALSLLCVILIITVACLFAVAPTAETTPCPESAGSQCKGQVVPFTQAMDCLQRLPLFVFAYTCHQNIISITNELNRPTPSRALLGMTSAISIAVVAYLVLAFAGYFAYGDEVKSDILTNYPKRSKLVAAARLAISLVVTLCYPLQAHPSRGCVTSIVLGLQAQKRRASPILNTVPLHADAHEQHMARPAGSQLPMSAASCDGVSGSPSAAVDDDHGGIQPISHVLHYGITACFICGTTGIALLTDDLGLVLKFVGATGSTTVSYILPGICYLRVVPREKGAATRLGALMIFVAGVIIMPLSLTLIFMDDD